MNRLWWGLVQALGQLSRTSPRTRDLAGRLRKACRTAYRTDDPDVLLSDEARKCLLSPWTGCHGGLSVQPRVGSNRSDCGEEQPSPVVSACGP